MFSMTRGCAEHILYPGHSCSSRSNIFWLHFMSVLYLLSVWNDCKKKLGTNVHQNEAICRGLNFETGHFRFTVKGQTCLFEWLEGLSSYWAQMFIMIRWFAEHMFTQVCLSVSLPHCCFHPVSLEQLVGFWSNFAQMFSKMRQCPECMLARGKFKVTFLGQTYLLQWLEGFSIMFLQEVVVQRHLKCLCR